MNLSVLKLNMLWVITGVCIFLGLGWAQNQTPDLTGTWLGETIVPDSGQSDEVTLVLEKTDAGYKGTIFDSLGMVPEVEIKDVNVEGKTITFTFTATDGYETFLVTMTLTYEEGKLVGYWQIDDGPSGDIEFHKRE